MRPPRCWIRHTLKVLETIVYAMPEGEARNAAQQDLEQFQDHVHDCEECETP